MTDEPQIESGEDRNPGEILDIRFQKNPNQKLKYLEAEPKILGVTQIVLAVFYAHVIGVLHVNEMAMYYLWPVSGIASMIMIIAGSLAVAAKNLHLPTLKACLGMQAVACSASLICFLMHLNIFPNTFHCWLHEEETPEKKICTHFQTGFENYVASHKLMLAVLIALSATLAAYCCKVIQCCTPSSSVPVITVNRPPDPR